MLIVLITIYEILMLGKVINPLHISTHLIDRTAYRGYYHYFHTTDKRTEAQRDQLTFPGSAGWKGKS